MRQFRLPTILHYLAFLFTLGLGVTTILTGAGVLSVGSVSPVFSDAGWTIFLILLGVGTLLIALHFLLVLADDRLNEVLYSSAGEWGRVEVSPELVLLVGAFEARPHELERRANRANREG